MQQNPQLTHKRILMALESQGLAQQDYVPYEVLKQSLHDLARQPFDDNIFDQLWDQCKLNSQKHAKVAAFIGHLLKAEEILMQKEKEAVDAIRAIMQDIKFANRVKSGDVEPSVELTQLKQLREGFADDLEVIRSPFSKEVMAAIKRTPLKRDLFLGNRIGEQTTQYNAVSQGINQNLGCVFYFALVSLLAQFFIQLYINTFMNSVLFLLIVSCFLLRRLNANTLKYTLLLTAISVLIDVGWYYLVARTYWAVSDQGLWPKHLQGYLKFSLVLISCVFVLKLLIALLLCSEYEPGQNEDFKVEIFGHLIVLSSEENSHLFGDQRVLMPVKDGPAFNQFQDTKV